MVLRKDGLGDVPCVLLIETFSMLDGGERPLADVELKVLDYPGCLGKLVTVPG